MASSVFFNKKIYPDKTLGEKLRALRKRKRLSLEQAEEETKVRRRFLEALEKDDYVDLPADVYTLGFLAKYADFLGASKEVLLEDYRRARGTSAGQLIAPKNLEEKRGFVLTPKLIIIVILAIFFAGLTGYIFYSVRNFTSSPNLEISSPSTDTVIRQGSVQVVGKTDEGATLQINDQTVFIDNRGNFKETVKLQPGLNNIELRATNRVKKETVKVIKILAEF